jgi:hypothetical protein
MAAEALMLPPGVSLAGPEHVCQGPEAAEGPGLCRRFERAVSQPSVRAGVMRAYQFLDQICPLRPKAACGL